MMQDAEALQEVPPRVSMRYRTRKRELKDAVQSRLDGRYKRHP